MRGKHMKKTSKTNWKKLKQMKDKDIDTSDISPLDEAFFKHAKIRLPNKKESITIRLDGALLKWFRAQGKGYQTKINAVLETYMKAHLR